MTEFEEKRARLSGHRRDVERARAQSLLAREAAHQAERALDEDARSADPRRGRERRLQLEQALKAAKAAAVQAARDLKELHDGRGAVNKAFETFTDPRDQLKQLSDQYPILLFPLRLETRFKTGANGKPQLWVRIFPDTCLIDTFEESLSEQEVANGRAFWARIWRARGNEALEREAWRELVASHGSGRAGWIVRHYMPINLAMKPAPKTDPSDVLLIITASTALPDAAPRYWEAAWKAGGSPAPLALAFANLQAAVGAQQARAIVDKHRPFNFGDTPEPPRTRADVRVEAAVLQLPAPEAMQTRRNSWSSPARIELLPDRFVFVGYRGSAKPLTALGSLITVPLFASPDPNAAPEQQLKPVDDALQIPDHMAWMFNFDKAVEVGMAMRIDLAPEQAADGFERVIVLGVRLSELAVDAGESLRRLLEHHLYSRSGLAIVQQGTPTNNTEQGSAGYSAREDSDGSFKTFLGGTPQYTDQTNPLLRSDGQWLADLLGLSPDLVRNIPNAGGSDQMEARAMQLALWNGTLGYTMKSLLAPVFSAQDIASTQAFFTQYVSGRGPIPALRIGKQPYGILPTTAFGRIKWFDGERQSYLRRLSALLRRIEEDWKPLADRPSHVGKQGGDPHQILLDVLGLHSGSVEYYPLHADGLEHKSNELAFLDNSVAVAFRGLFPPRPPVRLLRELGYQGAEIPELLDRVYSAKQMPLDGPIIDDRPVSERDRLTVSAGDKNYIEWLVDAAHDGIAALQQERGFDAGRKPKALLYLLLRHALQLGFHETGVRLKAAAGLVPDAAAMMREPATVHVREAERSESRYDILFAPSDGITRVTGLRLGDHIARHVTTIDPELAAQVEALKRLAPLPTARLERLFAEHLDCCTYRLDAWKTGLYAVQLDGMRRAVKKGSAGMYLGCYGWLEPLRPENKVLTPADLPADVAAPINKRDAAPLLRDSQNGGLIHAPSINHATTAAVLRSGYLANDNRLRVNLSSRRVRLALGILEGMRNGQSLGALLGYQLERHLHDNGPLQVRELVYPLRREFPLAANQIATTNTETGDAKDSIAAMNVVDGRKMIERLEAATPQNFVYPFGIASLPRRAANVEQAVTAALAHIRDINDAVADLVLAEGVHQAVLGNYERSAGTLDAFAKGNYPPEPDVVRTPRSGVTLTLRTAIHLSSAPPANPLPAIALTPLARAEPAVNAWLKDRLPAPLSVGCRVSFTDRATGAETPIFVDQQQLGLHPVDLLYRAQADTQQALGPLDDRILRYVQANHAVRHDRAILIRHTERVAGKVSWFELQALLRSLRALVTASPPLLPADLMRANDATTDQQAIVSLPKSRVETARNDLDGAHIAALDALTTTLNNAAVTIDAALDAFATTVGGLAGYRLPQTGTGFVYEWRAATYEALAKKVQRRVEDWQRRLSRYGAVIVEDDLLPVGTPADERLATLRGAELMVSTVPSVPPFTDADLYRTALDAKRGDFATKLGALRQLVTAPRPGLATLVADAKAQLPLTAFDTAVLAFDDDEAEIARFRRQLVAAVAGLKADVVKRVARVDERLLRHDATADGAARVKLLQDAAKDLFGDDFQMVPLITLPATAVDELANAWQHSASGALTAHLATRDFPVDDWLHGIARVREKMAHWENAVLLGDAFGATVADLTPLQLPFAAGDPWLALELPDGHQIASDRLLYTAHFAAPFDRTQPICGLLVDEWTEVIPGSRETTGIAFHYDRPNSEPPQAWLLALPAVGDGTWSWDELLDAVTGALDSAKRRAVEPAHIDTTPYSWFLPATASAYTFPEISISNNLLRNVAIYDKEGRPD